MTTASIDSERLTFRERLGYALGDTASNLFWMTFVYFGNMFYTDVFGIPPAAMALLFFATRIWDAVNDPLAGMFADRTNTRWGKFRPYILWMVAPFGICGTLAFVTPPFALHGRLVWAFVTYTLIGMVYTAINIPYSALMGVISPSSVERTRVSSYRFVGAYSGGLIVSLCTLSLVERLGAGNQQLGFALTAGLYSVLGMGMWLVCFTTTKERVTPPANQGSSFFRDLGDVVTNVPWLVLFLLGLVTLTYVSIRNGCIAYYFKYYVGPQTVLGIRTTSVGMVSAFFTVGAIANLAGTAFTTPLAKRLGKRLLYTLLMGIATVLTIAFFFLGPKDIVWMFVLQTLTNLVMGPTAVLVFAMYADASDYSEWRTGRRSTGLVFAASSFAQKMGWTLGGTATGMVLAAFGYQAAIPQSEHTLLGLRLLVSFIPAIASLLGALLPLAYTLTDERMRGIEHELAERRQTGAYPPTLERDRTGLVLGSVAGLAALGALLWLIATAAKQAAKGDWLFASYIGVIVGLFGGSVFALRALDERAARREQQPRY